MSTAQKKRANILSARQPVRTHAPRYTTPVQTFCEQHSVCASKTTTAHCPPSAWNPRRAFSLTHSFIFCFVALIFTVLKERNCSVWWIRGVGGIDVFFKLTGKERRLVWSPVSNFFGNFFGRSPIFSNKMSDSLTPATDVAQMDKTERRRLARKRKKEKVSDSRILPCSYDWSQIVLSNLSLIVTSNV